MVSYARPVYGVSGDQTKKAYPRESCTNEYVMMEFAVVPMMGVT